MEEREAQEIVRMVESTWRVDYGRAGRELWRDMLLPYDPQMATRAVADLSKRQRERPTIADLRQVLVSLKSRETADQAWRELPPAPLPTPEWVKRWKRARAAGDERIFPEQIPGYLDLQKDHPLNVEAYKLPTTPTGDAADWVQEGEYLSE